MKIVVNINVNNLKIECAALLLFMAVQLTTFKTAG